MSRSTKRTTTTGSSLSQTPRELGKAMDSRYCLFVVAWCLAHRNARRADGRASAGTSITWSSIRSSLSSRCVPRVIRYHLVLLHVSPVHSTRSQCHIPRLLSRSSYQSSMARLPRCTGTICLHPLCAACAMLTRCCDHE